MKLIKILIPVASTLLLFTACSKENPNLGSNITGFYKTFGDKVQTYTVDAGVTDTITGEKGSLIIFQENSFKDKNGNIITSGKVQVEIMEAYTFGDMVRNNINTTTVSKDILRTAGQIYINATQGDQQLSSNGYSLGYKLEESTDQPMGLYYTATPRDSDDFGTTLIWENEMRDTVKSSRVTSNNFYYLFHNVERFNWVNADILATLPDPKTDVEITLPSEFDKNNTSIFIYIPETNSVAGATDFNATTGKFKTQYQLPIDYEIKIAIIALINKEYYIHVEDNVNITSGFKASYTPIKKSQAQVEEILSNL